MGEGAGGTRQQAQGARRMGKTLDGMKSLKRQSLAAARIPYGKACRPFFALRPLNRQRADGEVYRWGGKYLASDLFRHG